jgi:hypothetical protein
MFVTGWLFAFCIEPLLFKGLNGLIFPSCLPRGPVFLLCLSDVGARPYEGNIDNLLFCTGLTRVSGGIIFLN